MLAHSKLCGWLIKWQWWSGKYQSDNIRHLFSTFGVSGCAVCSVAVCFQWLCCMWVSVCVFESMVCLYVSSLQFVCMCVCACMRVTTSVTCASSVCVCWLCVGLSVAHAGWKFMIGIFRLAWLSVWKSIHTQHKHTNTHTHSNGVYLDDVPQSVHYCMAVLVAVQCRESQGVCVYVTLCVCECSCMSVCVWNECKRHQTPPSMGLINDRWNFCCFSHRSTVCSNRNKAQNVQRDWWGRLRLEISLMLSATIHTQTHTQVFINTRREGSTQAWTCLYFTLPQSLQITWNIHITNKPCIHWTMTLTHIHPHTLKHTHTQLPKSFLCSSWGPSCGDVIACCHFADCDFYWKQSTLI